MGYSSQVTLLLCSGRLTWSRHDVEAELIHLTDGVFLTRAASGNGMLGWLCVLVHGDPLLERGVKLGFGFQLFVRRRSLRCK